MLPNLEHSINARLQQFPTWLYTEWLKTTDPAGCSRYDSLHSRKRAQPDPLAKSAYNLHWLGFLWSFSHLLSVLRSILRIHHTGQVGQVLARYPTMSGGLTTNNNTADMTQRTADQLIGPNFLATGLERFMISIIARNGSFCYRTLYCRPLKGSLRKLISYGTSQHQPICISNGMTSSRNFGYRSIQVLLYKRL